MPDKASAAKAPRAGVFSRLYRGDTSFEIVGRRKLWYGVSVVLLLLVAGSVVFKGFNFGVEFAGGNQFTVRAQDGTSLADAEDAVSGEGVEIASSQTAGTGDDTKYVIKTGPLEDSESQDVRSAIAGTLGVDESDIAVSEVSSSWGDSVSRQAIIALIVFLVIVAAYMWLRFELKMAISGLAALAHDVLLTAGVFSVVGFEVTPGTVVGMLTILGYSLYDTVVVFDRVQENTKGLLGEYRQTYGEAANRALNETLMRSINTSLIGLLPVAGLLFVGVGILGVGTLKDLALVLFVGMLTGTYSSIFLATPVLVDLRMMEPRVKSHARKVVEKRTAAARKAAKNRETETATAAADDPAEDRAGEDSGDAGAETGEREVLAGSGSARTGASRPGGGRTGAPRPGARPDRRKRPRRG